MLACVSCLMAGCFYVDPIEVHPDVTLARTDGDVPIVRGGHFQVTADLEHPDRFAWSAFPCADQAGTRCGLTPFGTANTANVADFDVPVWVAEDHAALTESVWVRVVAHDDHGALAGGQPSVNYAVDDARPVIQVGTGAASHETVGAPIQLFAKYSDPDDDVSTIAVRWTVLGLDPATSLATLPPSTTADETTAGVELVPLVVGSWSVQATATDPLGASATQQVTFDVEPDGPPCIAQSQPIVPPDGATLPITQPTLFQVQHVDDDLDAYPRASSDPHFGTAVFAWSIKAAGDPARRPLAGVTGNAVALDPAAFAPGQLVELRVEAFDRKRTAVSCPDAAPTCAAGAQAACIQRQTWQVEIR